MAANKIISLQVPELYAIVQGKVGKAVARLRGGFLLATLAKNKRELEDPRFAVRAAAEAERTWRS